MAKERQTKRRALPQRARHVWADLPLRAKGAVVVSIPVTALLLLAGLSYVVNRATIEVEREEDRAVELRTEALATQISILEAGTGVNGFLLTGREGSLEPYEAAVDSIPRHLERLESLARGYPAQEERYRRIFALTRERLGVLAQLRQFPERQGRELLLEKGKELSDRLRDLLGSMVAHQDRTVAVLTRRAEAYGDRTRTLTLVALPLGILGALLGMVIFTSGVLRRVQGLEANARRLAQGREIEALPPGEDELGRLGRAMEETSARLREATALLHQMQAELRQQALLDELTGLYNRRGFTALGEHELQVAARTKHPLAILFIDLDGMKLINDSLGHAEGDRALRDTAELLRTTLRASDVVARLGGDEFCALLPDCPSEVVDAVVRRLGDHLETHNQQATRPFDLSISVGIALHDPARPASIQELIDRADRAMYQQKTGRASV
jgi:diguanylate cyclase (GGDEF)-like protein